MNVRTFEATTMKEAVRQVKQAFGSGAVILETKEKNGPGSVKMFEVTASEPGQSLPSKAGASRSGGLVVSRDELIAWQKKLDSFDGQLGQIFEQTVKRRDLHRMEGAIEEVRTLVVDYLSRKADAPFHSLPMAASDIVRKLKIMRVDEGCLQNLVRFLKGVANDEIKKYEDCSELYESLVIKWLMKRIKIAPKWIGSEETVNFHVLVGPSGVGKTTTAAKICKSLQDGNHSPVLVSYDNNRLGAHEQARLYCKVLDVPFDRIQDPSDLPNLVRRHREVSCFVIDTGGCSPKDQDRIDELSQIKDYDVETKFHLVQSLTDQKDQLERSIRMFQKIGLSSLVFTKMDESWFYGEAFNSMFKWGLPLSWFGLGTDVPADLEFASRERLVERLLGIGGEA